MRRKRQTPSRSMSARKLAAPVVPAASSCSRVRNCGPRARPHSRKSGNVASSNSLTIASVNTSLVMTRRSISERMRIPAGHDSPLATDPKSTISSSCSTLSTSMHTYRTRHDCSTAERAGSSGTRTSVIAWTKVAPRARLSLGASPGVTSTQAASDAERPRRRRVLWPEGSDCDRLGASAISV